MRPENDIYTATDALLIRGLFPAWLVAGALDWYWHRQTKIEYTAGAHESLTHLLMGIEAGAGLAIALLFESTSTAVAAGFASAIVHEATTIWDVGYAAPRRPVPPREQHTHSFLEVLPFVTAGLIAIRPRPKKCGLRLRKNAPPAATIATLSVSALVFGLVPYFEEFVRCLRVKPTLAPLPAPT